LLLKNLAIMGYNVYMLMRKQMNTYMVRWMDGDTLGSQTVTAKSVRAVYKYFAMVYGSHAKIISLRVTL
jgi:hypothetical protein